jgi:formylglycine-generating enzyme required for sulfatase activity
MLVSNGEYLQFVLEGGYRTPEWWTEEGKRWIGSIKPSMPLFWHK